MGETALVTGAQGFGGAWLSRALLGEGFRVVGLDLTDRRFPGLELLGIERDVDVVHGDLADGELVARTLAAEDVELVFHLGARTIVGDAQRSPAETFETNIKGTWLLLEACRERGVGAVIVASSDKAYGAHDELPYREGVSLQPRFPYDVSKAAADLIARSYFHTYELPVAVARFANLYGGGDLNFSRLIPEAITAVIDGRRPVIRSDGTPERDYLYVEDAARAYLAIADTLQRGKGGGEAFNAGGGRPYSVSEVVSLICGLAGVDFEPDIRGEGIPHGEIDRQFLDSTKIREVCGWTPEVSFEDGLRRTLEWYRAHPEARAPVSGEAIA